MILRPTVTGSDPFNPTLAVPADDVHAIPTARHARPHRRRPSHDPLPGPLLTLWTMVFWAMAGVTTIVTIAVFGPVRNGLWLLAVGFYAAGATTLGIGWRRLP